MFLEMLKKMFKKQENLNEESVENKIRFERAIKFYTELSRQNPLTAKVAIKEFAMALFYERFISVLSSPNDKYNTDEYDLYNIIGSITDKITDRTLSIDNKSGFVAYAWNRDRLIGSIIARNNTAFEQDSNHKGFYLDEFDILFIHNGNHSCTGGVLNNNINITAGEKNILFVKFNKQAFFNMSISHEKIICNNGYEKSYFDWKIPALFKIMQEYMMTYNVQE